MQSILNSCFKILLSLLSIVLYVLYVLCILFIEPESNDIAKINMLLQYSV